MAVTYPPGTRPRGTVLSLWDPTDDNVRVIDGEYPLPISGEVVTTVTTSATDLQFNAIPVTGEQPLPVSGLFDVEGRVASNIATIAGAVAGTEMQVDVLTNVATDMRWGGVSVEPTDHFVPMSGMMSGPTVGPLIRNIEIDMSGVEYNTVLPGPLYGFDIKASGSYALRLAFATGETLAERYVIIPAGGSYGKEFMRARNGLTLVVNSDVGSVADNAYAEDSRGAQVVAWTE